MSESEGVARAAKRWKALRDLVIGDDFVGRLARANGWDRSWAERVDREYRRFLLIASATREMVVPSQTIDKAWHEHILHTRSYQEMCGILGHTFHHEPGRMDEGDAGRHADGYQRTLELYRRIFASDPPDDIWPAGQQRKGLIRSLCERIGIAGSAQSRDTGDGRRGDDAGGGWFPVVFPAEAGTGQAKAGHSATAQGDAHTHGHGAGHAHSSTAGHSDGGNDSTCGGSSCGGGGCGGD